MTNREEAIDLLERLAAIEQDPGAKGYAEGMADRLRAGPSDAVTESYVAGLHEAIKQKESA